MSLKDYNPWHKLKTWIHNENKRVFFHEREIWFCFLGLNIGFEQDGKGKNYLRPVVVIKKFNNEVFWAVPLTSKIKNSPYYYTFAFKGSEKNSAILSQIRLVDAKRLRYKAGNILKEDFGELTKKLKDLIP